MSSGIRARIDRALLVGLLSALGGMAPAHAEWDIAQLMQQLAQHPAGRAQFTETKTLALLKQPLVSSGELVYSPPDRLEKHTLKPKPESLVIAGNDLTVVRDGTRRDLRLPQFPEVLAFVEALRGTLVGNQALLQSHYALALTGNERAWQLVLKPLDERMQRWVQEIRVTGTQNTVSTVETLQADGDKSLITIKPSAR